MNKKLFYTRTGFLFINSVLSLYCILCGGHYNIILAGYFILLFILLHCLTLLEWKKQKKELIEDKLFGWSSILAHVSLLIILLRTIFSPNIISTYILEAKGIQLHGINALYLNSNFIYLDFMFMLVVLYGCVKGKTKEQS